MAKRLRGRLQWSFLDRSQIIHTVAKGIPLMSAKGPRRKGKVIEYQNGRWFMYITEWDEEDSRGRQHTEIEIHHNTNELVLYTTDVKQFDKIKHQFFDDPNKILPSPGGGGVDE